MTASVPEPPPPAGGGSSGRQVLPWGMGPGRGARKACGPRTGLCPVQSRCQDREAFPDSKELEGGRWP